jgi:hypothetical protein
MAYTYLFHGDGEHPENLSNFLQLIEDSFAGISDLSDSNKCYRFYLRCKSDFNAEYWYEELKSNSPTVLTLWSTFIKHFCVKWLRASTNSLLKTPETKQTTIDTATTITHVTMTTITATDSNNAITTAEQQDMEESRVGREEEEKGVEKQE